MAGNTYQVKEQGKQQAAQAALDYIQFGTVLGVGSGSTTHYFINALQRVRQKIEGVVASSVETAKQLQALKLPLLDLNTVAEVQIYVDGADAMNSSKQLLKGKGGALTAEKIIATVAKQFICIVDESKWVDDALLNADCPVVVEVMPMARSYVGREIACLQGEPVYRQGMQTDHGNVLLDVYHLTAAEGIARLEERINAITGVVENGIFSRRCADIVLIGSAQGVRVY